MPCKLLLFRSNRDTSPLLPHVTPVHTTAPGPQGNEVAVLPLQFQPEVKGTIVGFMVGFDVAGARVAGDAEGKAVGFDGQLVIPSLNAHKASASEC